MMLGLLACYSPSLDVNGDECYTPGRKMLMHLLHFTSLETARLILRHFTDADLVPFMAYRNDPVVARYQGWEGISEAEAHSFIEEQKMVQPGVPGQWFQIAIELKEMGTLVGDCALKINEHDELQ